MRIEDTHGRVKNIDTVKKSLELLSEEQRAVVLAYYYDSMSMKEIADIFDTGENTAESRLYLARKRLMTILEEKDEKPFAIDVPTLVAALDDIMDTNIDIAKKKPAKYYQKFRKKLV